MNHLLWDAKKALKIKNHWNQSIYRGVKSRFLITSSGLTVTQTSNDNEEYKRQIDPLKNNLYKRASCTSGFVFSLSKEKRKRATVAQRITLNDTYVSAGKELFSSKNLKFFLRNIFFSQKNLQSLELTLSKKLFKKYSKKW